MTSSTRTSRTLILVRHGLTDWNIEGRYQGRLDIPLNVAGRKQAEALKARLENTPFESVYSSPLQRAFETAQIIAHGKPIRRDARLAEIDHGAWQGKTHQEIATQWPHQWRAWKNDPDRFTPPGGESIADVQSRVREFLAEIKDEAILCVSHGVVIEAFFATMLPSFKQAGSVPSNASLHFLSLSDHADE
jgi:alpha-ribazole phosphatase